MLGMRGGLVALFVSVSCGLTLASVSSGLRIVWARQTSSPSAELHTIDPTRYTDPRQFAFLTDVLKDVEIVSLGESIHFTHEFPLVRLGIIKHLNEKLGFRVLAMEGSAADIWVAQDRFLNSPMTSDDARDAQRGLFMVWNTPEVHELFEYEAQSRHMGAPLYITAYDVQPGTGEGSRGRDVFRQLAARLRTYAPPAPAFDETSWVDALAPITSGCGHYTSNDESRVENAIGLLTEWSGRAATEVVRRFPLIPHAAVLRLLPENLKASLTLCRELAADSSLSYKGTRDTQAAAYTQQLKAAIPGGRLMLWAHLSHLFHNAERMATSVGEKLHQLFGPRLYTIMPLAGSGYTILIYDDTKDDVGYGRVHGDQDAVGRRLARLADGDFFLDLRHSALSSDPLFTTPHPVWVESGKWNLALAHDVDGIVWIQTVHAPSLPLGRRLLFGSLHYLTEIAVVTCLVLILLVGTPVYLWMRRRRRRRLATSSVST
jgi:erythromycin esterase-like protein